jgi:leucyl aminopeptidase (aminopeptidase T)
VSEQLKRAVEVVIRDCLGVHEGEEVLVVCNPATEDLGGPLRDAAAARGAEAVLAVMPERASHAAEPPATVAAAMLAAEAVVAPTVQSLSHTAARRAASEAGARIGTMPGATAEMLARVMSADLDELRRRGEAVCAALDRGEQARITCARGSDLRLGLEGRASIVDAGDLTAPGAFGNLPCGEGFIAPVEGTGEGTLVVDGSIAGVGRVHEPVSLSVRDGHLVEASGKEGVTLLSLLTAHGADGTSVAELGIGTNEAATLSGDILEDEKILGTAHIAFGASAAIGGTVQVPVHLDCVVLEPTVEVDGEAIVRDGELLV